MISGGATAHRVLPATMQAATAPASGAATRAARTKYCSSWAELPDSALRGVLLFLPAVGVSALSLVCRSFVDAARDPTLWRVCLPTAAACMPLLQAGFTNRAGVSEAHVDMAPPAAAAAAVVAGVLPC